jgi:hypothetical protein
MISKSYVILLSLTIASMSFAESHDQTQSVESINKAKRELKKRLDSEMTEATKGMKLKPYEGITIVKNQQEFKDCPKRSASEDHIDPKSHDLQKNCQCYYVQIDDLDFSPANLGRAMAVADFARKRCLEESKLAK